MSETPMAVESRGPTGTNPLLDDWQTPFGAPPFDHIAPEHFAPAFEAGLAAHRAEIERIAIDTTPPTFANVIAALERSGRLLRRVSSVFFNLAGSHTNEPIRAIERDIAPVLARHRNSFFLDERLWARISGVAETRQSGDLGEEEHRVLDRYLTLFRRSGAALAEPEKARLAEINERLAVLGTSFSQNVLADESDYALVLEGEEDLAGLPDFLREAAARAAADRGQDGKHVITLSRSSIEPFLQFSSRRDLREQVFRAWISRGANYGEADNRPIISEIVRLRAEKARLLGYDSYADFRIEDTMAKTPGAARKLLEDVWGPARRRALADRDALQALANREGANFELAPWDWRYYAEKRRQAEFDLEEAVIKPYLQLDRMIDAAFHVANRLFGLRFAPRTDVPVHHPDVRVWEVSDAEGRHVGLFLGDYFARSSKRSGAWKSAFRVQEKLDGEVRPIIVNTMNFSAGADGAATLLSFEDARTLFHEFGHALHGLLSDVTYPMIAGTNVSRDFVEFPSQLFEHWLMRPEILQRYAVHYRTGEPMPAKLMQRVLEARTFNQGFAATEYLGSALVDLDLHSLADPGDLDVDAFERAALERIGMPAEIVLRHRLPHFAHLFSGEAYAAGYYSYLWSEVLDADGFGAFEEAGDVFDAAAAEGLRRFVYSAGNLRDPSEAYRAFRGRDADASALLDKRCLVETPASQEV